jgi:hypothetical protein
MPLRPLSQNKRSVPIQTRVMAIGIRTGIGSRDHPNTKNEC